MERPTVLFVLPVAVEGGVAEVLRGLLGNAVVGGYEPRVVFLRPGPVREDVAASGLAPVRGFDAGRLRDPLSYARTVRWLAAVVKASRPDVIVCLEPSAVLYVAPVARRYRIPLVWQQHGGVDGQGWVDRLVRRIPARLVVANAEHIADGLRPLTHSRVIVIRPGIDVDRFAKADGGPVRARLEVPHDGLLVGIVGRLQPWKGQHLFLDMCARVRRSFPSARFVVVGGAEMGWETGDYPGDLRRQASRLGLTDEVLTFAGQVIDPASWTAACDVVVSASISEPYGLGICEAQAAGVAVVAVAEGGPLEIIDDGIDGLLSARTVDDLATAVERLVADATLRVGIGRAGARKAREQHGADRMAKELGRALHLLLAGGGSCPRSA